MTTATIGRSARKRGVGRPGPAPIFPRSVERRYLAHLRKRIRALSSVVRKVVVPAILEGRSTGSIEKAVKREVGSLDIRADASAEAFAVLDRVRQVFQDRIPPDEGFVAGLAAQVDDGAQAFAARLLVGVLPIESTFDTSSWVAENVKLIKSIDAEFLDDVALLVTEAQSKGWSAARAGREISTLTNTPLNRAKLVARNEISNINAEISQRRQTEAGIEQYRWSTSRDEKVRESHEALEGRIFDWSNPPEEGHPGEPINCRCAPIPVFR